MMKIRTGVDCVYTQFGKMLRKLREEKGLSQAELGKMLYVYRSTVTRWENGSRLPDGVMITRLAKCLDVDTNILFDLAMVGDDLPGVIMVDDNEIILDDGVSILKEVMPNVAVTGFIGVQDAVEYTKKNQIVLAVLDIELGTINGLELCRTLHEIDPRTNIVFLTAFSDYSLDAWKTDAVGFPLKPLTPEDVKEQLKKLHLPLLMGGSDE